MVILGVRSWTGEADFAKWGEIGGRAAKGDKKRQVDDPIILELLDHFSTVHLGNGWFEFPDLLGAGYEYLIKYLYCNTLLQRKRYQHSAVPACH